MRPSEIQICNALAHRLRVVNPRCFWTHIANESGLPGAIAARVGALHKASGKAPGVFDYLFLGMPTGYPVFWYEVKRKDGRLSDGQRRFRDACDLRGVPNAVGYSDDWVEHFANIERVLKATEAL